MIWTHALAGIIAAAIAAGAAWRVQDWRYGNIIKAEKIEALQQSEKRISQVTKALNEQVKRTRTAENNASHARTELDGLRGDIARINESAAASPERATAIGGLLADCAREYQELAGKAQRHVNDIRTLLEAWPK